MAVTDTALDLADRRHGPGPDGGAFDHILVPTGRIPILDGDGAEVGLRVDVDSRLPEYDPNGVTIDCDHAPMGGEIRGVRATIERFTNQLVAGGNTREYAETKANQAARRYEGRAERRNR